MIEIRWHGRGGQGAVTAAALLARAIINEGKYAQAIPSFGSERRGSPVLAFNRIDDEPILIRSEIYEPDIVVVLDPYLPFSINVAEGLKDGGTAVVNSKRPISEFVNYFKNAGKVAVVDATKIAVEELKVPITNTAILGAIVRATGLVKLESIEGVVKERFRGEIAEKNIRAVKRAYQETNVVEVKR